MPKEKVDETDLRILAELEMDARISDAGIARKTDLTPKTVSAHIRYLEQSGVIKGYAPRIDFLRLGYSAYRVYLKLQFASRETEERMIDYIKDAPHCAWCSRAWPRFDIAALFGTRTSMDFLLFWNGFRKSFRHNIKEAAVVDYFGDVVCGHRFTKEVYGNKKQTMIGYGKKTEIDERERGIIRALSANGRASCREIGVSVGLTAGAVKYRIDQLIAKKVIANFRTFVDYEKLGYCVHKVDFNLGSLDEQNKMEKYLLAHPNVIEIIRTVGWADIETRICARSTKELASILHGFSDEFPESVRDFKTFEFPNEIKAVCTLGC